MQRGTPYTKRRFYQLVKLYHPDTHDKDALPSSSSSPPQQLSRATRLERYHLVVAANDLLSDPSKRRLYDHHGIGWTAGHRAPNLREADKAWRHQPGNASRNATWEDWEQWRNERSGKPSEPMYMSNGTFAALVVCMCMVGALAQMNRAEAAGEQYVDFVQQKDWAIGQKMRENTMASAGRTKDERVDTFLRDRENLSFDFQPAKYDAPSQANRSG
ncbi:J domain-containing protein 1 [Metarhizium acridum]|uniref:J domain-containing protein 1 n=1 Tax=Metarhizium acridum TaxID=92637 RepID=UPI001C6C61EB|nr:J domain-containing protein 1 [Metarhizium acridum]